jgi:hypothetical protein
MVGIGFTHRKYSLIESRKMSKRILEVPLGGVLVFQRFEKGLYVVGKVTMFLWKWRLPKTK